MLDSGVKVHQRGSFQRIVAIRISDLPCFYILRVGQTEGEPFPCSYTSEPLKSRLGETTGVSLLQLVSHNQLDTDVLGVIGFLAGFSNRFAPFYS